MGTWPRLKNGSEVLYVNDNSCNSGANTQVHDHSKGNDSEMYLEM